MGYENRRRMMEPQGVNQTSRVARLIWTSWQHFPIALVSIPLQRSFADEAGSLIMSHADISRCVNWLVADGSAFPQ
jgi:hypothetical protein